MTTVNDLLATLNDHRLASNMTPLKSWKASRSALEAAIAVFDDGAKRAQIASSLSPDVVAILTNSNRKPPMRPQTPLGTQDAAHPGNLGPRAETEKRKKKEKKSKPVRSTTVKKVDDGTTIKLSDIARELGINPKVARAKMRRLADKAPPQVSEGSWRFNIEDKAKVAELIK